MVPWSLEVEVQFYILAPLMARVFATSSAIFRRGSLLGAIVGLAAVKSWMLTAGVPTEFWRGTIVWFLELFLTGFLLALQKIGYTDALSVEIFGRGLNKMSPEEAARLGLEKSKAVFKKAGIPV